MEQVLLGQNIGGEDNNANTVYAVKSQGLSNITNDKINVEEKVVVVVAVSGTSRRDPCN